MYHLHLEFLKSSNTEGYHHLITATILSIECFLQIYEILKPNHFDSQKKATNDSLFTVTNMSRNVCISAVDGQTGFLIAELLLTDQKFSSKVDSVCGLTLHPTSAKCKELQKLGVTIIPHKPGKVKETATTLKESGADALCIIPPTHKDKFDITMELVAAGKKARVPNTCLISSAGADMADAKKQPRLREFIDIEQLVMEAKGDAQTPTGTSPVVVR